MYCVHFDIWNKKDFKILQWSLLLIVFFFKFCANSWLPITRLWKSENVFPNIKIFKVTFFQHKNIIKEIIDTIHIHVGHKSCWLHWKKRFITSVHNKIMQSHVFMTLKLCIPQLLWAKIRKLGKPHCLRIDFGLWGCANALYTQIIYCINFHFLSYCVMCIHFIYSQVKNIWSIVRARTHYFSNLSTYYIQSKVEKP